MKEAIVAGVAGGHNTAALLVTATGKSETTVRKYVGEMVEAGELRRAEDGTLSLPPVKGIGSSTKARERDAQVLAQLAGGPSSLAELVERSGIKLSLAYASLWRLMKNGKAVKTRDGSRTPRYEVAA